MAKVGLKDVLALRAAGYSKKEIDALAAIDEENEATPEPDPVPETPPPAPEPEAPADPEPGDKIPEELKKQMEELQAKLKESEEKLKKLQQDNVHKNAADVAAEMKAKQNDSLLSMVRDFM